MILIRDIKNFRMTFYFYPSTFYVLLQNICHQFITIFLEIFLCDMYYII